MTGIKYTKLGIVCIASSIGRIAVDNTLLKAIKIPSGIPMIRESKTEINIIATVVIISGHRLKDPTKKMKNENSNPPYKFVKYHPSRKIMIIKTHHGMANKADSSPLIEVEAMTKIKSKNALKLSAKKSINVS